jgi:RNA polymerase sigma factor (sigma-70 family)
MEQKSGAYAEVLRRCLTRLGNLHDAEDAAQEVFARAAAQGGRDDVDWLLGVAHHVCTDEYRRRDRLQRAMLRAGASDAPSDPETAAIGELLMEQLLRLLTPAEGRLLRHRMLTEGTLDEAAAATGIASSTARNLAMRIRRKLRPMLPEVGPAAAALPWLRRPRPRLRGLLSVEPLVAPTALALLAMALTPGAGHPGRAASAAPPAATSFALPAAQPMAPPRASPAHAITFSGAHRGPVAAGASRRPARATAPVVVPSPPPPPPQCPNTLTDPTQPAPESNCDLATAVESSVSRLTPQKP